MERMKANSHALYVDPTRREEVSATWKREETCEKTGAELGQIPPRRIPQLQFPLEKLDKG